VIDADGRFRGMISRDELLRTGLGLIDKWICIANRFPLELLAEISRNFWSC
jgi:hypothetical protein